MKRLFGKFAQAALVAIALAACGDEPAPDMSIALDAETFSVSYTGGQQTVNVTSEVAWTATPSADWIKVTTTAGAFTVTVEEMESPETLAREGTVTVANAAEHETLTVSQSAAPFSHRMVGRWQSSGWYDNFHGRYADTHVVTITLIDDTTLQIADAVGLTSMGLEPIYASQDVLEATVDNDARTISIASQPNEPTLFPGEVTYTCRLFHDPTLLPPRYTNGMYANWGLGFEALPVVTNSEGALTINFSEGAADMYNAYEYWNILDEPARGGFAVLSADPVIARKAYWYVYTVNNVWTKL